MDLGSLFQQVINLVAGLLMVFIPAPQATSSGFTAVPMSPPRHSSVIVQSTSTALNLSATPVSGVPPLTVNFIVPHINSDWEIQFGDGSYNYGSRIAQTSSHGITTTFDYTYTYPGLYTVTLATSPANNLLGSTTITVSGSPSVFIEPNVSGDFCDPAMQEAVPITDEQGNTSYALRDDTHVYTVDSDGNCATLIGANPNTFIALGKGVGKDAAHVWIFGGGTENGNDDSILATQIVGADPSTLTLISDSDPASAWGEGFSSEYIKDKHYVYTLDAQDGKPAGQIVEGADPATFQATNGIEFCAADCQYDSYDKDHKYLHGVRVQQLAPAEDSTQANIFRVTPTSGVVPLTVTFTAGDSSGSESIDFGDGVTSDDLPCPNPYKGECPVNNTSVTHVYPKPGTYIATLWREFPSTALASSTIVVVSH